MNSEIANSRAGQAIYCRIGEQVYLSRADDLNGTELLMAGRALRHMDIAAASGAFRVHQVSSEASVELAANAERFEAFSRLASAGPNALMQTLVGVVMPMFQLAADPIFAAVVEQVAATPMPKASMRIEAVDGLEFGVALVAKRARLKVGDLLVSLVGDRKVVIRVSAIRNSLARDNVDEQVAALSFSGAVKDGQFLFAGDLRQRLIDIKVNRHADIDAFHSTFARRSPDLVAILAESDSEAGAAIHRLERHGPPRPVVDDPVLGLQFCLDCAIPLAHGLFVSGWFNDPEGLVERVVAIDHALSDPEISATWVLLSGVLDLRGKTLRVTRFVAFLSGERGQNLPATVPVRLVLGNGESHILSAVATPQDLRSQRQQIAATLTGQNLAIATLEHVYIPALQPLQTLLANRQSVRDVQEYGPRSSRAASLIIPLYRETGFLRSQLMAFSVDEEIRTSCEIVYVLDDPPLEADVASLLEGFVLSFPLDIKLVVLKANGGYALANNMGVSVAEGETLVLMNSDVIPDRPGWLAAARKRLETLPGYSVIGPKLVFADGNLQHAGMYFHRLRNDQWQNFHYWKGYSPDFAPANQEKIVPAVTGACMILRREDYLDVGGFTTDYVIGDYEDSDLCLKLRDKGGLPVYMPSLMLHHFERQSMPSSDDLDLGSTVYNRALHTYRWRQKIMLANSGTEHR